MKFSIAFTAFIAVNIYNSVEQVASFSIAPDAHLRPRSLKFLSQKQGINENKNIYSTPKANSAAKQTAYFGTFSNKFLSSSISNYFSRPVSSSRLYFKEGSDIEDETNSEDAIRTSVAKTFERFLPKYFSSLKRSKASQKLKSKKEETKQINLSTLSGILDVEALLSVSGKVNFGNDDDASENLNTYLDALLLQSEMTDDALQNVSSNSNPPFHQSGNSTGIFSSSSASFQIQSLIQETSSQINYFFLKVATTLLLQSDEALSTTYDAYNNNSNAIQEVIQNINVSSKGMAMAMDKMVEETETFAKENGLDVGVAVEQARGQARDLIAFGNSVLMSGYVSESSNPLLSLESSLNTPMPMTYLDLDSDIDFSNSKPLFHEFHTRSVSPKEVLSSKAGDMGHLAAAIYEDDMIARAHNVEQSIVASGTKLDVNWLITDSLVSDVNGLHWKESSSTTSDQPALVRTITFRGFDATDENVDRENLLGNIFTATPEILSKDGRVVVHSGLLSIARSLYDEISPYMDMLAPSHKIVFNGHSVGGSLANLVLMIIANERGADWAKEKILKVFTFGAPPIARLTDSKDLSHNRASSNEHSNIAQSPQKDSMKCEILASFGLPSSIVNGFCQPWDPCVRLFSSIDPIYPLLDDIGIDGKTLWANGPSRTLRPITRAIIESWENWPTLRDKFRETASQNYIGTGKQYLLLPDTVRYLTDRLVSVNVAVPETAVIVELPPDQLMNALDYAFPLDTFGISMVPAALRSFIHHFHPAYAICVDDFSKKEAIPSGKTKSNEQKKKNIKHEKIPS